MTHSVATTSGSGVTTTTTRIVGGKTIVTQVRHPGAYHTTTDCHEDLL